MKVLAGNIQLISQVDSQILLRKHVETREEHYSARKASIGSTRAALRAGM
jgi:hypothetical protein